jgi:hypothetical protein
LSESKKREREESGRERGEKKERRESEREEVVRNDC